MSKNKTTRFRVERQMTFAFVLSIISLFLRSGPCLAERSLYLNPKAPIEARVNDLLSRMTLEEKVAQMDQIFGGPKTEEVKALISTIGLGSILTNGTSLNSIEQKNEVIRLSLQSRLKIPVIMVTEAIKGLRRADDASSFVGGMNWGSTFNPALCEKAGRIMAREFRLNAVHWAIAPGVCIARDSRWGRIGETFGEDPVLTSIMGRAYVRGLQAPSAPAFERTASCAYFFVGNSMAENAVNHHNADISELPFRGSAFHFL